MEIKHKELRRLYHMLQYCRRIDFTLLALRNDEREFMYPQNFAQRDAVCFYLFQIGELARVVGDDFKSLNPQIPWKAMRGLRNIVAHDYGNVDFPTIWDTALNDIPRLEVALHAILDVAVPGFAVDFAAEIEKEYRQQ